jgi:hypothetical protein
MAKQTINIGTSANTKDGDIIRDAFNKVNQNFDELYNTTGVNSLTELAQDYASQMFLNGTHQGLSVSYNDQQNKLNLTVVIDGGNATSTF